MTIHLREVETVGEVTRIALEAFGYSNRCYNTRRDVACECDRDDPRTGVVRRRRQFFSGTRQPLLGVRNPGRADRSDELIDPDRQLQPDVHRLLLVFSGTLVRDRRRPWP